MSRRCAGMSEPCVLQRGVSPEEAVEKSLLRFFSKGCEFRDLRSMFIRQG